MGSAAANHGLELSSTRKATLEIVTSAAPSIYSVLFAGSLASSKRRTSCPGVVSFASHVSINHLFVAAGIIDGFSLVVTAEQFIAKMSWNDPKTLPTKVYQYVFSLPVTDAT